MEVSHHVRAIQERMPFTRRGVPNIDVRSRRPGTRREWSQGRPDSLCQERRLVGTTTWEGGKVPGAGARVQVREGHIVIYDAKSDAVIRFIHVAGTLSFANNQDTLLMSASSRFNPAPTPAKWFRLRCPHGGGQAWGDSHGGTRSRYATNPIDAKKSALIRLHYIEGTDKTPGPPLSAVADAWTCTARR